MDCKVEHSDMAAWENNTPLSIPVDIIPSVLVRPTAEVIKVQSNSFESICFKNDFEG